MDGLLSRISTLHRLYFCGAGCVFYKLLSVPGHRELIGARALLLSPPPPPPPAVPGRSNRNPWGGGQFYTRTTRQAHCLYARSVGGPAMAAWVRFVDEARRHRKRGGAAVTIQRHARGYLVRGARVSLSVCSLVFGFAPPRPRASRARCEERLRVGRGRGPRLSSVSFCRSRSLPHTALQSTLFASHSPQSVQQPALSSFLLPSSLTYTRTHRTRLSNERHL